MRNEVLYKSAFMKQEKSECESDYRQLVLFFQLSISTHLYVEKFLVNIICLPIVVLSDKLVDEI